MCYFLEISLESILFLSCRLILKKQSRLPKYNAIYFGTVFKLTESYYLLNYNSLYRVRLTVDVNKSGFVRPKTRTKNEQHHLKLCQGKHSNLPKDLLIEKSLLVDQSQYV